ncbi:MAG: hypothetical protein FWE32_07695 [Oscillospiraceae bacterium]|nr:hypothetical protein [Oscillospiraceae bacterium]
MENEIVMRFDTAPSAEAKEKLIRKIEAMPGIEYVGVSGGVVRVIGGDIDQLTIQDEIEGMGYPLMR